MENERAVIGGNRPPLKIVAHEDAVETLGEFHQRREEFLKALPAIVVNNRGDAASATDKIGLAQEFMKIMDEKRKGLTGPYREGEQAINAYFANWLEDLGDAVREALGKVDTYRKETAAKIKQQQAEQAALATPTAPVAPAPKAKVIRGDLGYKARARERKHAVLEDISKVPDFIMESRGVREALEKVATSMLAQFPDGIAGFKIENTERTGVQ